MIHSLLFIISVLQQKIILSRLNGSVRVDMLCQSMQRHPIGGLLHSRPQFHALCCISPSNRCFTISSPSVSLLFWKDTLALWPTVALCLNGFIGYALASELQWDGWHCKNLSLCSFYLRSKCNSLFTNYSHHFKLPDLCGYRQSITRSVHLLSNYK
jgi:hypothetical protein